MLTVLILMYVLAAAFFGWLLLSPAGRFAARCAMVNLGLRPQRATRWQCLMLLVGTVVILAWQWHGSIDQARTLRPLPQAQEVQEAPLAPPPSPPRRFFADLDWRLERTPAPVLPRLLEANRNWQLLDHDFEQRLLLVFKIMKEVHGYDMVLLEGYRSPFRQQLLATRGSGVTGAAAFQSYHQYGLAADCAFLRHGQLLMSEKDPWTMRGYRLYGGLAEAAGLQWGGRWSIRDFGHIELRKLQKGRAMMPRSR
ncbi:M15 family metallopeptidase [Janthinobacterium agaricidamnosum]|uniref:D-alanyl-D-alanine carboxypeptidase family protein n=1 Tax=Janthinobacterium agaricidamnosum NBRC 102515 = DSM 9628 TaxID=1349767 RepID=W0V9L1_9BURK|nr:M15 family metallopeptidase [Janthinobacterium agaricidamnosum]CDG84033.1 D-alanyl-D-alanine carboxypeptidase family protein [Janthinobacterium agaricidamnosum NBRC 102515 = DSM 9628]